MDTLVVGVNYITPITKTANLLGSINKPDAMPYSVVAKSQRLLYFLWGYMQDWGWIREGFEPMEQVRNWLELLFNWHLFIIPLNFTEI